MFQIRLNCFETNSSSTHSLIICDDKTWKKFVKRKLYYNVLSHEAISEHEDRSDWSERHPFGYSLPKFLTKKEYKAALPKLRAECGIYLDELVFKFSPAMLDPIMPKADARLVGHYIEYFLG